MGTTIRPELSEKNPYWIERHRYYELKHFCLQYPIWKKAYAALDGLSRRPSDLEVFSKKGEISDPTVRCVEARSYYIERMKTVEQVAIATDAELSSYILKGVTEGWSYDILKATGGLVSWFTGDNDIASFGTSLVSFGKNFAQYSNYMKNVDANIVTATTNAATSIVELQKSLPKEGGWFSDDMTLSSFGSDMASFGSYFGNYYNSISGIDTTLLSSVITQTNRLVSMANGMVGLDTSGMTSFSSALTTLGETGVTGFINAFNNAGTRVTTAASSMLASFINGANAKKSELTTTFITLVQAVH